MRRIILLTTIFTLVFSSCKKDDAVPEPTKINSIPEFYVPEVADVYGANLPEIQEIAGGGEGVLRPQDLDFHPNRNMELWVLNKGTTFTGGSTVTISGAGTASQDIIYREDQSARHFMALPTALSFSNNGNWATSAGVQDANYSNGSFTGPTLWSSDMSVYARPSGGNGSHLDMLHGSPFSMGIESESDNIFWVYDGWNQQIVRYDFVDDHGPGADYHGDGRLWRYPEIDINADQDLPSHMVLDEEKRWLYFVDGGNQRVLKMDITTGSKSRDLALINEPLAEHIEMLGVDWKVVIPKSAGLQKPCGIELSGDRLFVTDNETGDIICYNANSGEELARVYTGDKGVTGITLGPDNKLWFTNISKHAVYRVNPR